MTWFAFQGLNNGQAIDLAGTQEKEAVAVGFHGYATQAEAQAKPDSVNLLTRYIADALIADYNAAVAEGSEPGGPNATITNPTDAANAAIQGGKSVLESAANAIPGVGNIDDAIKWLSQGSIWERGAEIAAGLIILYIGVRAIAQPSNPAPAKTSTIKKAGKAAAVL